MAASHCAIALQAFPQSTRAEGFANESVEPEKAQYCYTLNTDGSENIVDCPSDAKSEHLIALIALFQC